MTYLAVALLAFLILVIVLAAYALVGAIKYIFDKTSASSISNLEEIAERFGLSYIAAEDNLPGMAEEISRIKQAMDSQLVKAYSLIEVPQCSSARGKIGNHQVEIATIRFDTKIATTFQGFLFGDGRGRSQPSYRVTRITIDGTARYVSLRQSPMASTWAFADFAPADVVVRVLTDLEQSGRSADFEQPNRCVPGGKVLGMITSWVCWSDAWAPGS